MALTYFETDTAPASTYDALRELWWWANDSHPTKNNTLSWECLEVWDGTNREAPAAGRLTSLASGNLWKPDADSPPASLPEGAWAVFRSVDGAGAVAARCVIFVRMEASGQAGHSLVPLDDWTVGGGTGASPTLPTSIIGQPPAGDGDGRFPSSGTALWSMLTDGSMFIVKQFPTSGVVNGWTYMGEVDATTDEDEDPRPFVTPRNTTQFWGDGLFTHVRRSPVDDSTLVDLDTRPYFQTSQDSATAFNDLGLEYLSNVSIHSSDPVGHRFIQGYFRHLGATDETVSANRATMGSGATDYAFEAFGINNTSPRLVTRYAPGTSLAGGHSIIAPQSIPTQLSALAVVPAADPPSVGMRMLRHLLPKSYPWNLVHNRGFVKFMRGISLGGLDPARANADELWDSIDPQKMDLAELVTWERQWALRASSSLTVQERRDRLDGVWSSTGGQSPGYITDTLQANGFDVYTHEWWDLTAWGYPAPKDPRDYLLPEFGGTDADGYLICNIRRTSRKVDEIGAGEAWAQAGEPRALSGYFKEYEVTNVGDEYVGPEQYYLYIGGSTFPDTVNIPTARRDEFETLCRQICPAQQCLVLRVRYV